MRKQARKRKNKGSSFELGMKAVSYGDVGTCDHFITKDRLSQGYDGETHSITFRDRASGWVESKGVIGKSADAATDALRHWIGPSTTYRYMYSGGSQELKGYAESGYLQGRFTPGTPNK